jgi:hypothetical protein
VTRGHTASHAFACSASSFGCDIACAHRDPQQQHQHTLTHRARLKCGTRQQSERPRLYSWFFAQRPAEKGWACVRVEVGGRQGGREGSHPSYSLAGSPVALQLGEYSSRPLEHLSHFVVHQLLFWCWLSLCARHDGCQGGRVSQSSDNGNGQARLAIARGKVSTAVSQALTKQTRHAHAKRRSKGMRVRGARTLKVNEEACTSLLARAVTQHSEKTSHGGYAPLTPPPTAGLALISFCSVNRSSAGRQAAQCRRWSRTPPTLALGGCTVATLGRTCASTQWEWGDEM